jgi:hypothetical protein
MTVVRHTLPFASSGARHDDAAEVREGHLLPVARKPDAVPYFDGKALYWRLGCMIWVPHFGTDVRLDEPCHPLFARRPCLLAAELSRSFGVDARGTVGKRQLHLLVTSRRSCHLRANTRIQGIGLYKMAALAAGGACEHALHEQPVHDARASLVLQGPATHKYANTVSNLTLPIYKRS